MFLGAYNVYRVFQKESTVLWENVHYVNLHRYNRTYLQLKLKLEKKKVFLRRYVLHLFNTIRYSSTAGESILELIAKPNHA